MNITKITQICLLAAALTLTSEYVAQVNAVIQPSVTLIYGSNDTTKSFQEIQDNAHAYFANYHALNGPAIPKDEKRFKRWEYFWQNKVCYPNQTKHGDLGAHNFYKNALQTNVINTCLAPTTPLWSQVGPTTMANSEIGIINCVAVDPNSDITNPSTVHMFAGSYTSGLFKSIDGGTNWTNITDYLRLPSMGITSIAIDKHDLNSFKMLFSTGNGYTRTMSSYDYGVYYSTNGGSTWLPSTFIGGPANGDLGIDLVKYDESDIWGLTVYAIGGQHIYKSTNGGQSFTSHLTAPAFFNYGGFKELEIDLDDPNYVYATTNGSQYNPPGGGTLTQSAQLWISSDAGLTWTQQAFTLPGGLQIGEKITVEVTPANPNRVYVATKNIASNTLYFYYSNDKGVNWHLISQSNNPVGFSGFGGHFEISNTNENTFYIGDLTVAKSTNAGASFTGVTAYSGNAGSPGIFTHADIRYMDFVVPNTGIPATDQLMLGTDGGVLYSNDAAVSWQNLNGTGLSITQFYGFDDHLTNTSLLVGGTQDNNTMGNATGQWNTFSGGDGGWTQRDDVSPNVFYGNANQDIMKFGAPGANLGNPAGGWKLGMKILIDPCVNTKLWFGLTNLYYRNGPTWTTKWVNPNPSGSITAMAIAPSNCNIIYLAYGLPSAWDEPDPANPTYISQRKLFKSTDGGATFTDISNVANLKWGTYWSYITDIVIDPLDPNHVYYSFAGYWAYGTTNNGQFRVMETHDGTNTVDDISDNNNLPPFPVVSLEYQKGSTGTVFAGTDVGIYKYDYVNDVWECFNNNMPSAPVTNMEINYCTNPMQMTASTFGRGIYKCNLTAPTADALTVYANVNNVCAGTPVTLTASGGAAAYNWNPTGQTGNQITVNPAITTIYQVSTTDVCGNPVTATIKVFVDNGPPPTINISASPTGICPGTQTFLSVSGVPNYTWQPQGLVSNQLAISHAVSGPYTYTVFGNATGGCVAQQNITINVLPSPILAIAATSTVICTDNPMPVTLTANGADTYIWTSPDLQQTTTNPISVQPLTASTYTVKGTNALGCSASSTVQVVLTNCDACSNCYGTLSYAVTIPTLTSVGEVCVTNDLTIYGNVTFLDTEFKISAGKKIIVTNGAVLTILRSHLYACTDMWQGIEIQNGGRIEVANSLIEDAIVAISSVNNTQVSNVITATFAIFNKNYIGIAIEKYNQAIPVAPYLIRGCVFTCRQIPAKYSGAPTLYYTNLSASVRAVAPNANIPYASDRINDALYPNNAVLLPPYANEKPEAGVTLTDVGLKNYTPGTTPFFNNCEIGSNLSFLFTNYFDNLKNGIISKNSNLHSINNVFQNSIKNGNGIYAISDDKNFNCVIANSTGNTRNKFIDCGKGIFTQNIFYHNITLCEFKSSKTQTSLYPGNDAIWASTYKNEYFRVINNTFYNYKNGVTFSAILGDLSHMGINATSLFTNYILISNNTVAPLIPSTTFPVANAQPYVSNGINVFGVYDPKFGTYPALLPGRTISIDSNNVTAYRAINLQGFYEILANINKNNIKLEKDHLPGTPQEYGITIVDCAASSLSNTYNNFIQGYGNAFNNPNNHGILYKHTSGIKVTCNRVRQTYNGLSFNSQNSAVPVYNNTMRQSQIGLLLDNNGTVGAQVAGIGNAIGAPNLPADNVWFGPPAVWSGSGVYKTFARGSTAQNSPMYVQSGISTLDPTGFSGSLPSLFNTEYSSNVSVNTVRAATGTTPVNCATNIPPSLVILNNPKEEFEQIVQDQNPVAGNATKVRRVQKNNVFRYLKSDQNLLASSSILQNFYNTELNTNNEAYFTIEKDLAEQQIAPAASALAAVANQDDMDENHQVYDVCLLHYRDTTQTFTPADSAALTHLCGKCPYTEGFVVFRARALYNEIYHVIENFADICDYNNSSRLANKTADEITGQQLKVELYPNPTNDKFSIVTETVDAQLSIQILDIQGKVIFTDNVYVKNYATTVQASLSNGVYIVSITDVISGTNTIKKLVVQK